MYVCNDNQVGKGVHVHVCLMPSHEEAMDCHLQ